MNLYVTIQSTEGKHSENPSAVYLQDTDSSSAVKDMMKGLDDNQDGKVSFQEYLTLVGYLANSLSEQKAQSTPASEQ
uniref:Si:ch211-105c13.3 n=1 Tax=Sinocyclocheilus rhinocerous TaxID=307959 RepID=A0A673JDN9_9TELE